MLIKEERKVRKIIYSFAAVCLLIACTDKDIETLEVEQTKEVVSMNEGIFGTWQGLIEIPQMPLEVIINLQKEQGALTVPAQGLTNLPFKNVQYDDKQLKITIDLDGSLIKIEGHFENDQITATFTQSGQTYPLILKPYTEAAITYEKRTIPVEGGTLQVALQMPEHPTGELVIIHAGSGPTNKDGNTIGSGKNDSLKMIAESLAVEGIASVRFDKRGIGENMSLIKQESELRFEHYVNDVVSIIDALKPDERFTSIHLIGHSEGALIMTLAAQKRDITSLTLLAGAGRPADEILLEQLTPSLPPNLLEQSKNVLEQLKNGEMVANVSNELQSLFRPSVQPYMMSWLKYNPQQELAKVKAPILIVQGKKDLQVTEMDAKGLQNGNKEATVRYFEQMNHVLKDITGDRNANLASYTNPNLPLSAGLIYEIVHFIR